MLSKFSVKKPYTVLVAVAIVIVLGALSFQNMSTDFLPDMESKKKNTDNTADQTESEKSAIY